MDPGVRGRRRGWGEERRGELGRIEEGENLELLIYSQDKKKGSHYRLL